jgi:hypothetical protein
MPRLRLSEYQVFTEDHQALPYGLKNAASEYAYRTPRLFVGPMAMLSWIYLDHHLAMLSTWSISGNTMKARFIDCPKMATPALGLHTLSTPRLNTSTMTNMI